MPTEQQYAIATVEVRYGDDDYVIFGKNTKRIWNNGICASYIGPEGDRRFYVILNGDGAGIDEVSVNYYTGEATCINRHADIRLDGKTLIITFGSEN